MTVHSFTIPPSSVNGIAIESAVWLRRARSPRTRVHIRRSWVNVLVAPAAPDGDPGRVVRVVRRPDDQRRAA